jgi:spore maturation protein CgeB
MNDSETIVLLTYYYHQADRDDRLLRHIIERFCPAYLPWSMYLYEPLQKIFSRVVLYDYLKRRAEVGLKAMNEEVIELVRREHPKYVLWTSFYNDVRNSTLETIRKEGAVVVGWFFDDEFRFNSYSKYWAPYLGYCVTNAISAVPRYQQLGTRVIQTIPNTGIAVELDWPHLEEERNVTFVGSIKFNDRMRYVDELKRRGILIEVFGEGSGGYVTFDDMLNIFKTSKINLNFSKAGGYGYRVRQIKGRVFQVCLAGGFLLTEHAPGIENYFEPGKEIACFDSPRDMVDKVAYYLEHDEERRTIARAGWERAAREYSSSRMVAEVFSQIEDDLAREDRESAPPQKLKMPVWVGWIPSDYHFQWARALLEENDREGRWREALTLSLRHNPLNLWAWYYLATSLLPTFVRPMLFKAYRLDERIRPALFRWLSSVSFLRGLTEGFLRKIW